MDLANQPLKQPNELTVLIPRVGKLSGVGRKLHVSLMRSAQLQLRALASEQARTLKATEFFKAPLAEIIRPISKPGSNLIQVAKDYVDKMQSTKVEWTAPEGTKEGVLWDQMVLITQAKIALENGRLWLYWGFPPDMVAALSNPQSDYTLTRPEELKDINGYAAISLYIIASRYKNNPSHCTCIKPTAWWIEALRGNSSRRNAKDKVESKLPAWRKFKSEKVVPAIDEINTKSPLYVEIVEIKEGQAVKQVQFKVWLKSQFRQATPVSSLHIQAAALGIPREEITNHLKSGHAEADLLHELAKLSARKENASLPAIKSTLALFREAMRRTAPIQVRAKVVKEKQSSKTRQPSLFDKTGIEPAGGANSNQFELTPTPTAADVVFDELAHQPSDVVERVLDMVKKDLARRNVLTPVISKRIEERNWRSGSLRAHAIEIYAVMNYGEDWKLAIENKISQVDSQKTQGKTAGTISLPECLAQSDEEPSWPSLPCMKGASAGGI